MKTKRFLSLLSCCLLINYAFAQFSFTDNSTLFLDQTVRSGAPIGVVDVNGDFRDDIVRLDERTNLLIEYQQADGSLTNYSFGPANPYSWSLSVADVTNNGYADLLTGGINNGVNLLYGNGTADYINSALGGPNIFVQGSNFADINNDGFLDAFVCHDNGPSNIYINDGTGLLLYSGNSVIDVALFPTAEENAGNYGTVWTDFDHDGDIDLYIAKCRLNVFDTTDVRRINQLYVNDGAGNYTESAADYNLANGWQSWTAEFQDVDNDGDLDCFLMNHDTLSQLLENVNNYFVDITALSGINITGLTIQATMKDFDNDGYIDLLTTDHMYRNNGDKTFTEITPIPVGDVHSFAVGDVNQDGFTDVYAGYGVSYNGIGMTSDKLWLNDGNNNNFLAVSLQGVASNRTGVGARIILESALGIQVREVRAGESYGITNSATQIFGMAAETDVYSLTVEWPSGTTDVFGDVAVNQFLVVKEGACRGPDATIASTDHGLICSNGTIGLSAPAGYAYSWSTGETTAEITVTEEGVYQVTVTDMVTGCYSVSNKFTVLDQVDLCNAPCSYALNMYGVHVDGVYTVENYLLSAGQVIAGGNVVLQGNSIELIPGFEVEAGAGFIAEIQTCISN